MNLFGRLYQYILRLAVHRRAPIYLGTLSCAESSFFPIPPDVMLLPMSLAKPDKAWRYAAITTLASVLGGIIGYLLGWFLFDWISPWLHEWGYWPAFEQAQQWYAVWGVWVVLLAGFSPIPYKVFTIASGAVSMSPIPFIIASLIGRGSRFYLVAGLARWGGPRYEPMIRKNIEVVGWLCVIIAIILFLWLRY